MPKMTMNKRNIERLRAPDPSGKQVLWWDADLKGFGILVSGKTNAKTFIVQRDIGGRARRVTVGGCNILDLDKARGRAIGLLAEFAAGLDPKAERKQEQARTVTLRAVLEDYLRSRKDLREHTRKDYRGSVERHLADWLDRPLRAITPDMVEQKHAAIQEAVAASRGDQPAHWQSAAGGHTANNVCRVLRLLWNHQAERDDTMVANPVRRLRKQWFAEPRRERVVRAEELPGFYAAIDGLSNPVSRDFIKLLLFTGLRRAEAAALRWDEIDFAARVIRLPAKRTKAGRRLDLPMTTFTRDLLVARRAIGNDGGWVFPADSKTGHLEEPSSAFDEIAAHCGVTVSSHDMRRTFTTIGEATDISPMALKALVNHSIGGDVTAGYVQITIERLREPAQRVCDRLQELCNIQVAVGVVRILP